MTATRTLTSTTHNRMQLKCVRFDWLLWHNCRSFDMFFFFLSDGMTSALSGGHNAWIFNFVRMLNCGRHNEISMKNISGLETGFDHLIISRGSQVSVAVHTNMQFKYIDQQRRSNCKEILNETTVAFEENRTELESFSIDGCRLI